MSTRTASSARKPPPPKVASKPCTSPVITNSHQQQQPTGRLSNAVFTCCHLQRRIIEMWKGRSKCIAESFSFMVNFRNPVFSVSKYAPYHFVSLYRFLRHVAYCKLRTSFWSAICQTWTLHAALFLSVWPCVFFLQNVLSAHFWVLTLQFSIFAKHFRAAILCSDACEQDQNVKNKIETKTETVLCEYILDYL